jgi:hypothetical protein
MTALALLNSICFHYTAIDFGEIDLKRICNILPIFGPLWPGTWACWDHFVIFKRNHPINHLYGKLANLVIYFMKNICF